MHGFKNFRNQKDNPVHGLVVLFFMIIYVVPLSFFFGEKTHKVNWVEGRAKVDFNWGQRGFMTALKATAGGDLTALNRVIDEQFINRSLLKNIELAASDQFPFRLAAIHTAKAVDRFSINLSYMALPDPAIPADMHSDYYILRAYPVLIHGPERFKQSTLGVIDERISNYHVLIESHPEVNFYAYHIERIQSSRHHPLYGYFDGLEGGQYFAYFKSHKPAALILAGFSIRGFDDHLRYYYQTDHHLNDRGVLLAYQQIHGLLRMKYSDISPERTYDHFIGLQGVDFRGTAARTSFYPLRETIFEVVDYALPPHKIYEHGEEITYGHSADYLAGIYPSEAYYNHYEGYFGGDKGLIEFIFENQTDRNLLIFGNSFDNALLPLIASHYHHTYSVDMRYDQDFSLSAFLAEHDVDDILVIGEDSVVFSSRRYQINP